jgi:hypothetical protein
LAGGRGRGEGALVEGVALDGDDDDEDVLAEEL